jgi:hypothetical protein
LVARRKSAAGNGPVCVTGQWNADIHEYGGPANPELNGGSSMHGSGASEAMALKAQTIPAKAF